MTDRDYGDRGRGRDRGFGEESYGRGFNRDINQERYGRGINRDYESEQYGRGVGRDFDDERYGRGFNRESTGARDWNRGWGGMAGEDWNRGGIDQSRYYGSGFGGQYGTGGSMYGGEQTRWSSENIGGLGGELRTRGKFSGRGPKGWRRSDERIQEEVNEALARNPDIDASDLEVRVENGEVTLTGVVEDRGQKRLAEDIVEDVFGVEDVNNDLKIRHGFLAGLTGEKADEREITRGAQREPSAMRGHSTSKSGSRSRPEASGR